MKELSDTVALVLWLLVVGFVVGHCAGCQTSEGRAATDAVESAAAVARYRGLLDECRARGRDAGSYAVYDACADAVDRLFCRESALRCTDGGAP